jgi:hypothetical protein
MIATVTVTRAIGVSADAAWAAIAAIGGLDRWFPVIATCEVEGEGVGATRILGLAAGGRMVDRIEEINSEARRFRYSRIELPLPVTSYAGTVLIRDAGEAGSEIAWRVAFEVAPEDRDGILDFVETALSAGTAGLEKDLRGG